jgi:ribosomal protein L37E
MSNKRGRKSKLTPERCKRIYACIEKGMTDKATCAMCGIGVTAFYRWQEEKQDFKAAIIKRREGAEYELYSELLSIAMQEIPLPELTLKQRQEIVPLINTKSRTLEWILTHRYSETYAERQIMDNSENLNSPFDRLLDAIAKRDETDKETEPK